jgi:ribosomal protein S18 acetylase RimI-like enzyme
MIRRAAPVDLPALGALGAHLMRFHYGLDPRRFLSPGDDPESGYAWFLETQLQEPESVIFIAELNGAVAGYVHAGLEPISWKELRGPAGFIYDIVVTEHARRSGIATELMKAGIGWLREHGAPRAMLWTATGNIAAQRLFEAFGFRRTMTEMTLELDEHDGAADETPEELS